MRSLVKARQAASVLAFVKHAINIALSDAAGWKKTLDQAPQEADGPLTPEERAWADAVCSHQKAF